MVFRENCKGAKEEKDQYFPDRIYSVGDSSITVVKSKVAKVIGLEGKKQIALLTSGERGTLIKFVSCMIARGSFVSPL